MDEWLFISLAKTKADAPGYGRKRKEAAHDQQSALTRAEVAAALDLAVVEEKPAFRGAAAFVGAVLVNAAFITAIDDSALEARTPKGEVIVAQLDPVAIGAIDERRTAYEAAAKYVQ